MLNPREALSSLSCVSRSGHQWSGAHPGDKLYFWLTVGMAGWWWLVLVPSPLRPPASAAASAARFDVKVTKSAEAFPHIPPS